MAVRISVTHLRVTPLPKLAVAVIPEDQYFNQARDIYAVVKP